VRPRLTVLSAHLESASRERLRGAAVRRLLLAMTWGFGVGALALACGSETAKVPSVAQGGQGPEGGSPGSAGLRLDVDAGTEVDPTLGGPCEDEGQCDDRVDCTIDSCDAELGRCRHSPDDARCDDDQVYCNGVQRCDIRAGCQQGEVVACSDGSTCTIDVCVEETQSCRHEPRDADGDGDPTRNCGGQDCDDDDASVNTSATEVCGNERDDDCDGSVDESDCASPEYDRCATALAITAEGYYDVDLTATKLDYPTECTSESEGFRDAVLSVVVPDGGPWDLDVTAKVDAGKISLGTAVSCGDAPSASCEPGFESPLGGSASRLLLGALDTGAVPIYVAADGETTVQVRVALRPAEPRLGELCEDAVPLEANGAPLLFRLPGYKADVKSECSPLTGDAFATFTLAEPSDVTLLATAQTGLGLPIVALFDASCRAERTCRHSQPGRLFERNLEPGTYRVMVAGLGPDDVELRLGTEPVTDAPLGEGCDARTPLEPGVEQVVDLSTHEDAVHPRCLVGAADATFEFSVEKSSDIALVGRLSKGDDGAVSLATDSCTASYACQTGQGTLRAVRHGVAPGTYRAVIESTAGNPVGLSYFERPPVAQVRVALSDDCSAPVKIPESGGVFTGNTANSFPDFSAGCDVGGQPEGGAPDQLLVLELSQPRRVILDTQGSGYATVLSVRAGDSCPGAELPRACAAGYRATRSYLDLDLQAGRYFVQIDGYDGASGAWRLEVFSAPL
jgi:Putative metal-binding motif